MGSNPETNLQQFKTRRNVGDPCFVFADIFFPVNETETCFAEMPLRSLSSTLKRWFKFRTNFENRFLFLVLFVSEKEESSTFEF